MNTSHDWKVAPVEHVYDGRPLYEFDDPMDIAAERVKIRFGGVLPRDVSLALNDAFRRGMRHGREQAKADLTACSVPRHLRTDRTTAQAHGHGVVMSIRQRIAQRLRFLADRIDNSVLQIGLTGAKRQEEVTDQRSWRTCLQPRRDLHLAQHSRLQTNGRPRQG